MAYQIYTNVTSVLVRYDKKKEITTQKINRKIYVWMDEEMDDGWMELPNSLSCLNVLSFSILTTHL